MQHECIPQALLGMDIICQAKSGMGKTAVFVLSTLHLLEPKDEECPSGAYVRVWCLLSVCLCCLDPSLPTYHRSHVCSQSLTYTSTHINTCPPTLPHVNQ